VIKYGSGALNKAQLLQRYLRGPAQLKEDSTLRTVDVAIIAGTDYGGVRSSPSAALDATTSTIPRPEPTPAARGARAAQPAC
jgi:hypothetical protein